MNGAATRRGDGLGQGRPLPGTVPIGPNGRALVEGYRKDVLGGFETEKPLYNPLNAERPESSPLVDLKDPIQVHLLTETALSDSKGYEILSQEEVDDIKKQIQYLTMRIEQARTNLAIQSKYRDAAISMAKLYSPSKPEGKRRSLLGNRMSDSAKEAEMEKQASERCCEELATELFTLEKRLMVPQRRLLQHTAGILQMTHRASAKKSGQLVVGQPMPNGIPGSPESLYTYTNARNSLEVSNDDVDFDDRSLYLPLEKMNGQASRPRKNTIEIPVKSPIREQTNQLREEMERLKEENARLKAAEQRVNAEAEALRNQTAGQEDTISETEKRLEVLNNRLREVIIAFNPAKNGGFSNPMGAAGSGETLDSQLEYLEDALTTTTKEQSTLAVGISKDIEIAAQAAAQAAERELAQAEGRVEGLIGQLQDLFSQSNIGVQLPPEPAEDTLNGQLDYVENALRSIGSELERTTELSSSAIATRQNSEQVEAVLAGLWDIIQTGLAEAQEQKAARRKMRAEKGLEPDEEDIEMDEPIDLSEPYSLQGFSAKVQWLFAQATNLKEQKGVLQRQIKQQRELNNKSGSEKDQELKTKMDELAKLRVLLETSEKAALDSEERLAQALSDLDTLQRTSAANESASTGAVQEQLNERTAQLAALEASYQEAQMSFQSTQEQIADAEASAAALQKDVKDRDDEIDRMNMMVIELKTEVAIAKAELDGAYGSRKQRAAEAAALSKSSETAGLTAQVAQLKEELASTLREFEEMTKESVAAERERLELEGKLDDAMAAQVRLEAEMKGVRARLEAEIGRLQEQLDAERLKVPPSPAGGMGVGPRAGASMLSEQFRATMKEERKKFQEELREEQAKRRRLEDELRAARKNPGGVGRSPLGPLSPR